MFRHIFLSNEAIKFLLAVILFNYLGIVDGRETALTSNLQILAAIVFENGDETEPFLSSYNASLPFLHVTKPSDPSLALQIIFKMTAFCYLLQLNLDKM